MGLRNTRERLHVLYGDASADRVPELKAIAEWMADWARDINAYDHNLIALGDFNIDRSGDALYEAFTSTGLTVPGDLLNLPRTIFSSSMNFIGAALCLSSLHGQQAAGKHDPPLPIGQTVQDNDLRSPGPIHERQRPSR